ncbi:MAG: hypothetical protein ACUVQ8_05485 [Nitrososphaeria archaeon]
MFNDSSSCNICGKKKENKESFCEHHKIAYQKIEENFKYWKDAFDGLNWEDYLKMLIDNPENGIWVKEVAQYLITNPKS